MIHRAGAATMAPVTAVDADLDAGPLDNDEQDAVIDALRSQAMAQSKTFKNLLCALFSCLALAFLGVLFYTHHYPWEISHQSVMKDIVSIACFKGLYATMSVVCMLLAVVIKVWSILPFCFWQVFIV
jgi:hypothetical protein